MTRGSGLEDVEGALREKRDLPSAIVGESARGLSSQARGIGVGWEWEYRWVWGDWRRGGMLERERR